MTEHHAASVIDPTRQGIAAPGRTQAEVVAPFDTAIALRSANG